MWEPATMESCSSVRRLAHQVRKPVDLNHFLFLMTVSLIETLSPLVLSMKFLMSSSKFVANVWFFWPFAYTYTVSKYPSPSMGEDFNTLWENGNEKRRCWTTALKVRICLSNTSLLGSQCQYKWTSTVHMVTCNYLETIPIWDIKLDLNISILFFPEALCAADKLFRGNNVLVLNAAWHRVTGINRDIPGWQRASLLSVPFQN